jgi:hypothetical protein
LLLRESPLAQVLAGSLAVGLLAGRRWLVAGFGRLRRRIGTRPAASPAPDPATLRASIRARHPDFDEERVDRIAESIIERDAERGNDE